MLVFKMVNRLEKLMAGSPGVFGMLIIILILSGVSMTESKEQEMMLAVQWHEGRRTAKQTQWTAEIQGIDFKNVREKFNRLQERRNEALK